jgi:hypothetical protein
MFTSTDLSFLKAQELFQMMEIPVPQTICVEDKVKTRVKWRKNIILKRFSPKGQTALCNASTHSNKDEVIQRNFCCGIIFKFNSGADF